MSGPFVADDRAVSEQIGTLLLVALGVVMASLFGYGVWNTLTNEEIQHPEAAYLSIAAAGGTTLQVEMSSGNEVKFSDVKYIVSVNGADNSFLSATPTLGAGTDGKWSIGEVVDVAVSGANFVNGDIVELTVVHTLSNTIVGESATSVGSTAGGISGATYAIGTLTMGAAAFAPSSLEVGTAATSTLTASVDYDIGTAFVNTVYADLRAVGGSAIAPLTDGGTSGDATAGDGTFSYKFSFLGSASTGTYAIPVYATDVFGRTTSTTASLTIVASPTSPLTPPFVLGVTFTELPGSEEMGAFKLRNWQFINYDKVPQDVAEYRVEDDDGRYWRGKAYFTENSGTPYIDKIVISSSNDPLTSTVYTPSGGLSLDLNEDGTSNAVIDLLRPWLSTDDTGATVTWDRTTGSQHDFWRAGILEPNTGTVPYFSDDPQGESFRGIGSARVVFTRLGINVDPTASVSPATQTITMGNVASVSITGSDTDGDVIAYLVNWGDGTIDTVDINLASELLPRTMTHTYATAGTMPITVVVTDNAGGTGTAVATITSVSYKYVSTTATGVVTPPGSISSISNMAEDGGGNTASLSEQRTGGGSPYRFGYEFTVPSVPTTSGLTHTLEIRYRVSSGTEGLRLYVKDGGAYPGTPNTVLSSASLVTYQLTLSASQISAGTVTLQLIDDTQSGDNSAGTWLVDYVRVVSQ